MRRALLALSFTAALSGSALAQTAWPTPTGVAAANGAVMMCLNGSSQAVPCSGSFPLSTSTTIAAAVGITPTDRTITSASGASQTLMAANASRHSMTVVNTGNANCGVNPTGGTAVIGGAGTLTLTPLGAYTPRIPTLSAVTVICTAAQPIYADEN
jgi:hypothetical protein